MLYAPMDHGKCVVCLESLKKDAAVNTSDPAAVLLRVTSALQYFQFKNILACVASGIRGGGVRAVPPPRKYPVSPCRLPRAIKIRPATQAQ